MRSPLSNLAPDFDALFMDQTFGFIPEDSEQAQVAERPQPTPNYQQWIAAHQPTDPRGRCFEMTVAMVTVFPELRRVRGYYICPLDGRRAHWWCETPGGQIVDPTVEQFSSCGMGEYEEYTGPEPTGHCLNCNAMLFTESHFCNDTCARECVEWMNDGGTIAVNGKQVWP